MVTLKLFPIFCLILCVSLAHEVPGPHDLDFDRINGKLEQIKRNVNEAVDFILMIAKNENVTVSDTIKHTLITPLTSINILVLHMRLGTSIALVTEFLAEGHYQEFSNYMRILRSEVDLYERPLSPEARTSIGAVLQFTQAVTEKLWEEIITLLSDPSGTVLGNTVGAADWDQVVSKYYELESLGTLAMEAIVDIASAENSLVGKSIERKLEGPMIQSQMFWQHPRLHARAEILNVPQADAHFLLLKMLTSQIETDLSVDISQLSDHLQVIVKNVFIMSNDTIDRIAEEVRQLFQETSNTVENSKSGILVDWDLAKSKVEELSVVVNNLKDFVINNATSDNPIVGNIIEGKLELPHHFAQFFVMHARLATVTQKWSVAQARGHFVELNWILNNVKVALRNDLGKLSPETRDNINVTVSQAEESVSGIAEELYVILSM